MKKNFQRSPWAILLLSGMGIIPFNVACDLGGSNKSNTPRSPAQSDGAKGLSTRPATGSGAKDSDADPVLLNLAQSEWQACLTHPADKAISGLRDVYKLFRMKFSDSTVLNGKLVYELEGGDVSFASDSICKSKISPAQAAKINGRDLELDSKLKKGKYAFGKATGLSGVYELDVIAEGKESYLLAKITEKNLQVTIRCDEDHAKEKLCSKIDGDRPDNRAKTWDMYKDNDPGLTRVK